MFKALHQRNLELIDMDYGVFAEFMDGYSKGNNNKWLSWEEEGKGFGAIYKPYDCPALKNKLTKYGWYK
jgi:hypothetical protein